MANGFSYPKMKIKKIILIAFMFGLFQGVMPLIGYFIGHTVITYIEKWIPWIALIILGILGGRMLYGALKSKDECEDAENCECKKLTFKTLIIQSIATSIDALSVGLTIANYSVTKAIICASFITLVTFACSFGSVFLGKKFGTKLGHRAEIIGGIILILIGIEIFVTGMFF
jgi:putative Mn2+ efflux pump MntP